jgi:hypothetical protein
MQSRMEFTLEATLTSQRRKYLAFHPAGLPLVREPLVDLLWWHGQFDQPAASKSLETPSGRLRSTARVRYARRESTGDAEARIVELGLLLAPDRLSALTKNILTEAYKNTSRSNAEALKHVLEWWRILDPLANAEILPWSRNWSLTELFNITHLSRTNSDGAHTYICMVVGSFKYMNDCNVKDLSLSLL